MLSGELIQEKQFKKALEYSEQPEVLEKLLRSMPFSIRAVKLGTFENFESDKEKRDTYEIIVARNGKTITFRYVDSLKNTMLYRIANCEVSYQAAKELKAARESALYSILTWIRSDFYCPDTFEDFCSEFGYGTDSIKAEKLFRNCREQSKKLQSIFTSEEMECFPS